MLFRNLEGKQMTWSDLDGKRPPVAPTTEGPSNDFASIAPQAYANPELSRKKESYRGASPLDRTYVTYHAQSGRTWRYRGKRGCVIYMLVTSKSGLTQHDTYPWHTRLGGTIHALRQDGLEISTELEGPYRHARYRLHTPGRIVTRKSGPAA